jgi:hypothetical protein
MPDFPWLSSFTITLTTLPSNGYTCQKKSRVDVLLKFLHSLPMHKNPQRKFLLQQSGIKSSGLVVSIAPLTNVCSPP